MSFFWKLYFSIMAITITGFSVGGYLLIQTGFDNSLKREIASIYQENDILVNSITLELSPYLQGIPTSDVAFYNELLKNVVSNMTFETLNGNILFCIRMENSDVIYQNTDFNDDINWLDKIGQNNRGYVVEKENNKYMLHSICSFSLSEVKLYFENQKDISELFINRENQYKTLLYNTIILSLVSGMVIFIVTRWLVSPIKKLSQATQKVASGDLTVPVIAGGEDEIGQLTKDFNTMVNRLQITMNELHEALERQEIFVGNFAHELKTPLTSIIGYGDMLRTRRLGEEEIIDYASLIVEEGKRLETMAMKLLELTVLKKQDFKMYFVDALSFFAGIEKTVSLLMAKKEIEFIVQADNKKLYLEPDLMKTVCLNLLDNAYKAVGKKGKINLIGKIIPDGYQIIVQDNGCGMESTELSKIKEAFYMVDKSRSRSVGGAGLGLALCQQIIDLHHGTINFKSALNQGTTVIVELKEGQNDEKKYY